MGILAVFLEFRHVQKNVSFQASNINSSSGNLTTNWTYFNVMCVNFFQATVVESVEVGGGQSSFHTLYKNLCVSLYATTVTMKAGTFEKLASHLDFRISLQLACFFIFRNNDLKDNFRQFLFYQKNQLKSSFSDFFS